MPRITIVWIIAVALSALILTSCAHTGTEIDIKASDRDNAPVIPPPSGGFDPGTASVMASVMSCTEGDKDIACTFRIDRCHGTGPATPPLALGQEISVTVSKRLAGKEKDLVQQLQMKEKTFDLLLEYQHPTFGNETVRGWRAVRISPNPTQ